MTDKPTWITDAAKEIEEALGLIGLDELIVTAIEKHCPDDKGAGKLLDKIKTIADEMSGIEDPKGLSNPAMRVLIINWKYELVAALAEYEELNK